VVAIVLHSPRPFTLATALRFLGRSLVLFVPAFALAYLVMIAAWPWAAASLLNPVRAVFAFAHFQYPIKTLLFGDIYMMAQAPRAYVPVYLAIKLPLVLFAGAALALLMLVGARNTATPADRLWTRQTLFVAAIAVLPVALQFFTHGPAFTGMRHFSYVVPPLAVLAGVGFDRAMTLLEIRSRALARTAFAVIGACYLWTASALVRLHPYEYLYFNELAGGLAGATTRFDTDYWVNIMHEAVAELERHLDREGDSSGRYLVAVCGERQSFEYEAAGRQRLAWAEGDDPADFFIAPTHMQCDQAVDGAVIIRIERMGTLVGVVKDRRPSNRTGVVRRP
jgi:hypothetical protein